MSSLYHSSLLDICEWYMNCWVRVKMCFVRPQCPFLYFLTKLYSGHSWAPMDIGPDLKKSRQFPPSEISRSHEYDGQRDTLYRWLDSPKTQWEGQSRLWSCPLSFSLPYQNSSAIVWYICRFVYQDASTTDSRLSSSTPNIVLAFSTSLSNPLSNPCTPPWKPEEVWYLKTAGACCSHWTIGVSSGRRVGAVPSQRQWGCCWPVWHTTECGWPVS